MVTLQIFEHLIHYGVATISRLLQIIGLLCRTYSLLQGPFAKETYNFNEPTNGSHPIEYICGYTGCMQEKSMEWQRLVRLKRIAWSHLQQISDFRLYFVL